MIQPSIGRVVLFWPAANDQGQRPTQPWPALVAHVHNDRLINVAAFSHNGYPFPAQDVYLRQDDDAAPDTSAYAEWMPYQIAAASVASASPPPAVSPTSDELAQAATFLASIKQDAQEANDDATAAHTAAQDAIASAAQAADAAKQALAAITPSPAPAAVNYGTAADPTTVPPPAPDSTEAPAAQPA